MKTKQKQKANKHCPAKLLIQKCIMICALYIDCYQNGLGKVNFMTQFFFILNLVPESNICIFHQNFVFILLMNQTMYSNDIHIDPIIKIPC